MLFLLSLLLAIVSTALLIRQRRALSDWMCRVGWLVPAACLSVALLARPEPLLLRKLIANLALPTALLWIGLLSACYIARRQRRVFGVLLSLTLLYTVAGNRSFARLCINSLESPYFHIRPLEGEDLYDAVFMLAGGARRGPGGRVQLNDSGDRLRVPAALYHAGRTPTLVSSGSSFGGYDLASIAREIWMSLGVPEAAIITLQGPVNTAQEIEAYATLIEQKGWGRVALVTSATHMRRAQILCSLHGVEMTPLPTDFQGGRRGRFKPVRTYLRFIPQAGALIDLETTMWEYMGLFAIRIVGH